MLKKIIIGVVAIAVIVVGALWAAVTFFLDSATIADQLKKEAASRLNRELVFTGELQTTFFPKVQIVLPQTSLSYEGKKDPQFVLNGAQIGVAVMPLLTGNVQFDEVVVDGLRGIVNLKRLAQKTQKAQQEPEMEQAAATSEEGSSFIKNLEVAGVEVKNSALTVYGLQDQKVYTVSHLNLKTGKIGLKGTTPVSFSTDFSEKTQGISGKLQLSATATYDVNTLEASLADLKTSVQFNQGQSRIDASVQSPLLKYAAQDVLINDAAASVKMNSGLEASLKFKSLQTQAMKDWSLKGLQASVNQGATLSATLNGDFDGAIDAMTAKSSRLDGTVKTQASGKTVTVPFNGMVSVQVPEESASLSLNGELDREMFSVNAQVKGFSKPNVTGQVQLNALTVDHWIAAEPKKTAQGWDFSPIAAAVAQKVERLTALEAANANVGVKLNKLNYQKLAVTNIATTVKLQSGQLNLNNISARVCQGSISGQLGLNADQKWSVNVNASQISTQCLMQGLSMPEQLTGNVRASVKLNGTGLDETALMKTAKGSLSMQIDNAVLKGISLEKVAAAVKAKNPAGFVLSPQDQTRFSALNATASVGNGVVNVTSINGKSSVAQVSGHLQLGLLTSALDGELAAQLSTSVDGRKLTVPIKIGGTAQEPSYGVDIAAALVSNVKNIIENEPEKLLKGLGKLFRH
ncbi:MAG TPA: AsmA family protein [Candidatus Aphodousia gallistercoris]|nr:AsmA family protein [Candidatus Aphodousia gallistercoris]